MTSNTWTQTFTGKKFTSLDPRVEDVCIEDIAHGLSHVCRFSGQCREFYSVADHSLFVAEHVEDPALRLAALMHDFSEAYIVDVPAPIKPHLNGYLEIESRVMDVIAQRFGVDRVLFDHPLVKKADMMALATEKRDLLGPEPAPWIKLPSPSPLPLVIRSSAEAKRQILMKFKEYGGVA